MRKLAINRLRERRPLDGAAVDRFLTRHTFPIVEGQRCTFCWRGDADEVWVRHRIVGQPQQVPMRRLGDTDLWFVVLEIPEHSRVEYQIEIRRGESYEQFNDPLNDRVAHSPVGSSTVLHSRGYVTPEWACYDPDSRPGELHEFIYSSKALRRQSHYRVYLPARFRVTHRYPLLIVHDGDDYLNFASMKVVLDNLIHRLDMAETVVVFTNPGDRNKEYANSAAHARFITHELVPYLESEYPLLGTPAGRGLMGASFGGVASLSTAYRTPDVYGSLILQSGSFVFTDIGMDHGGGPVFDPVVRFVNRFREQPRKLADQAFMSCGTYEPLITANRSLLPALRGTGMAVRYVEARDGHSWEDWRDRLQDALSWTFPGPQKYVYE